MAKTALIVDDSASARVVLSRMLSEHALNVDTAASAEQALEYLRHQRPDVVFMDHLMPGMDGFQALEAIKANPATATIPVMMYTSQEGELYVGQARALGAFGVLPKQVKPVEVSKVLQALHLIPGESGDGDEETVFAGPKPAETENSQVQDLLEDLFHQQRAVLQEEIRKGYQSLLASTLQTEKNVSQDSGGRYRQAVLSAGALALALAAVSFAYLYFETNALLQQSNDRIALLVSGLQREPAPVVQPPAPTSSSDVDIGEIVELLEWGVNQAGGYQFAETALDISRAELLSVLLDRLGAIGFSGAVTIGVHVGRYCMDFDADGVLQRAPAAQPVEQCEQLGWPEQEAQAIGAQQTLAFANVIATVTRDDLISVQILSHGSSQPRVAYPTFTQGLTAGEWNAVADQNNRVDIGVRPE